MDDLDWKFKFDDLEPEPGPKFKVMTKLASKREKKRLDVEHNTAREARLEEQRATQPAAYVPNPLRRHTEEQLREKRAKQEAQSVYIKEQRLKKVSFE
jgi:hypothetical protein